MKNNIVDDTIVGRASTRAFLPTEVSDSTIQHILSVASKAPSGANMQPWNVYVVTGNKKLSISQELLTIVTDAELDQQHTFEYPVYPSSWTAEPYYSRRFEVGKMLYESLDINHHDKTARATQFWKNFEFFGAPVGIFFTVDEQLTKYSWCDYGMFIQNVMLSAQGHGLGTCAQGIFLKYHSVIKQHLNFSATEKLVCGMSLGYPDTTAPENKIITPRVTVDNFTKFLND
jgi:nitroreductase